jgi:hypothetical protein
MVLPGIKKPTDRPVLRIDVKKFAVMLSYLRGTSKFFWDTMRMNVVIAGSLVVILLICTAGFVVMQGESPVNSAPDDTSVLFTAGNITSEIRSYDAHITFSLIPETAGERTFLVSWELLENDTIIRSAEGEQVSLSSANPLTMEVVAERDPAAEYTFRLRISSSDGTLLSSITSVIQRGETGTEVSRLVIADKQM